MKIFRNVRQKLAAENSVAKYLRYAVGEIVLVVIGILIASFRLTTGMKTRNKKNGKQSIYKI